MYMVHIIHVSMQRNLFRGSDQKTKFEFYLYEIKVILRMSNKKVEIQKRQHLKDSCGPFVPTECRMTK